MSKDGLLEYHLRPIQKSDNKLLAKIIRDCIIELDAPKEGTVFSDPSTDRLYEYFLESSNSFCIVAESTKGEVLGLCGIYETNGLPQHYAELVKLYLKSQFHGLGIGNKLLNHCIELAAKSGYRNIYIETEKSFKRALELYKQNGFNAISNPLGNTGHYKCNIWLTKEIQ